MISNLKLSNLSINCWKWQYLFVLTLIFTLAGTNKASSFDQSDLERLQQTNSCQNCNLKGVNLAGATLMGANLEGANLQGVSKPTILASANLKNADLSEAKLSGAVLFQANLEGANLSRADLSVVLVTLLNTMSIHCTDLREANVSGANLSHANLRIEVPVGDRWIAHGGAPLRTENICNPGFVGANFSRANLKDAKLEGIELKQIVLCETMMPNGSISNFNCTEKLQSK
jgi:uncharacterized protein YjbI with pentapeptide repeats